MTTPSPATIVELGRFGLIDHLAKTVENTQPGTIKGIGDDAAVVYHKKAVTTVATELLLEGIHFDLVYTPFKHLGYKLVIAAISNVYAMNATPRQILIAVGLSKRFELDDVLTLFSGIRLACERYHIDIVGIDTSTSLTGLTLSATVVGEVAQNSLTYRSGGKKNDLLCLTGNLGAAYMGLQLLEREKRVFESHPNVRPKLIGHDYLLERHLKPEARKDIIDTLAQHHIIPTAMINVKNGLATDVLQLSKQSHCGVRIYLERIPIAVETFKISEEIKIDAVTAALHGGDDYELLFTLPVDTYQTIRKELQNVDIIGHLTDPAEGYCLITPDQQAIELTAQGMKTAGEE